MDDASYFEKRAIECIMDAAAIRHTFDNETRMIYDASINRAIQLLALARIVA